jgi:CRISPR-associated protein Csd1
MSWIQQLYETYERCADIPSLIPGEDPLLPIAHTTQQAHVQITLDGKGNFQRGEVVNKESTLVPATEKSAGRSGRKPKNHPLCDKLQYVAGDFLKYGGQVTSGFSEDPQAPHREYLVDLSAWAASPRSHPKLQSVLTYVKKGTLVEDLVREEVIPLDANGHFLAEWDGPEEESPAIFKVVANPQDAFVRWRVEIPGDTAPNVWEDRTLARAWIDYYESQQTKRGICLVTGQETALAEQHPAKLRHAADKAKIISSNDASGFTFRGRFETADQAAGVGFEVTQKAHNALRWLIGRQGFRNGDQAIVAWAVTGQKIPNPYDDSRSLVDEEVSPPDEAPSAGDAGQNYSRRLRKAIAGYRQSIGDTTGIVVLALDSATPGRMSMTYYRELTGADFLERLLSWHQTAAWPQNYGRNPKTKQRLAFIGAPAPADIAESAYGKRLDAKLKRSTVERLLPCIVDGQPIPRDLVESLIQRACNRVGMEHWEWEKTLGIACALFRKQANESNWSCDMTLETERNSRDYLYGRLLAVAENVESAALKLANENRETNASRLMHRFADRPFDTWPILEKAIAPYKNRLRASKYAGLLIRRESLLDEIMARFQPTDFEKKDKLTGEFLLGYHCQRAALFTKSGGSDEDNGNEAESADHSQP